MNILKLKSAIFGLLAFAAASVLMISCEQENIAVQAHETITSEVVKQRSELAKHLSIMVAEQPDFNQSLKTMCLAERANGYYEKEFFFNIEKDKTSELFEGSSLDAKLSASRSLDLRKALDYLVINDPGLAILMIGDENATEFNTRVYVDNGFDEDDLTAQVEYYKNGVQGWQSVTEVPSTLTFIVRESEAYLSPTELLLENPDDVTKIGTVEGNTINVFGYNSDVSGTLLEEMPEGHQTEIESRGCPHCPRDIYGGKERMFGFRTSNDHDPWKGSGEFIFDVVFADNGSGITSLRFRRTGVDANQWYFPNWKIITWTSTNDLDRMKYTIMEDDGGATYTMGLGLSGEMNGVPVSGSAQVSYTDGDDFVGETIIEYCDPIRTCGSYYEFAGSVKMALMQF